MSRNDDRYFSLPRFSLRRKSNQNNLLLLLIVVLAILAIAIGHCSFNSVQHSLDEGLDVLQQTDVAAGVSATEAMADTEQAISVGRTQLLVVGTLTLAVILWTMYRLVLVGIRAVALEVWIRRMGQGDLDYKVEMEEKDEITELAVALEVLRQRSVKALQLDLVRKLSNDLQKKNAELEQVLVELRQTQDQVVQRQKLVELGELTAGVAHEIRNPLNFVKNFSEASGELLDELKEALEESAERLDDETTEFIEEISQDLSGNLERTLSHVERADRIVHDMLMIGRGVGEVQSININTLLRDHAMLAYHSARALDQDFLLDIREEFDPNAREISVVSDHMGRVFLNMVSNACYATDEKRRTLAANPESYAPTLWLQTIQKNDSIEVRIRDNGTGIPSDVIEKIFNPFFTTKPTDKGTGLGLSLSNDIVREHGGSITPVSEHGEFTEMIISLPLSRELTPANG